MRLDVNNRKEMKLDKNIIWCIHHNDLDGRCAAAIVNHALKQNGDPGVRFIEVDYGNYDRVVPWDAICPGDTVYVVDFSLKPDHMTKLQSITGKIIWIDHHKTAQDYPYQDLPGLRAFDGSYAGCELTWLYFYPELSCRMPRAVQLIGDYDKWALHYPPDCFEFYEGMKIQANNPLAAVWRYLFSHDLFTLGIVIGEGKTAIRYRDTYCADMCETYGYAIKINAPLEGHPSYRAWCTNIYRFGSQGFGPRFKDYDLCVGYVHDGRNFTVSLYSTTVDVSEIAKIYGGGGHKGAAGFVCEELPWKRS
jgi:hypothetical protein